MRFLISSLILMIPSLAGCVNDPKSNPPQWTEETLFNYVASLPGGESGFSALNGDDFVALAKGVNYLKSSGAKSCENLTIEDHYIFFKRSGPTVTIRVEPAFVPDPENVSGVYPKEDGTQRVIVAPIDGARQLRGCFATIATQDNGLSFSRADGKG